VTATATLAGTLDDPEIELVFDFDDRHPNGQLLRTWVKRLPGATWDGKRKLWRLTDPEMLAPGELRRAGLVVQRPDGAVAKRHEVLPPPIVHDPPPATDPDDLEVPSWFGLALMEDQDLAARTVASGHWSECDSPGAGKTRVILAAAAILGPRRVVVLCPPVVTTHWLRETAASGLGKRCREEPGAVESRAFARRGSDDGGGEASARGAGATTSVAPPRPVTPAPISSMPAPTGILRIAPSRKEPNLPETGIIIVPDSLVAARPALLERLVAWAPDLFVYDEAHRAMGWDTKRSRASRRLARVSRWAICATGTPMFAKPPQMAPMLAMTGQLDAVFGGRRAFYERYARPDGFGGWVPRKQRLGELRRILDEQVWVRRGPSAELPGLSRYAKFVDVDPSAYDAAYAEVTAKVDVWLDTFLTEEGRLPSPEEQAVWAGDNLGFISQLRKAAGLVKVPAAAELVAEWVSANVGQDDGTTTAIRPLVVWTHHKAVTAAMAAAVPTKLGRVEVIDGQTSDARRDRIIDDFQASKVHVLVCQLVAAGVGITLTRSSDALFVETDWTPDLITQAEARLHRIGQESHVRCTTLIAPGTLDEVIHTVLLRKIEVLGLLMPERDHRVSVHTFADSAAMPSVAEVRALGAADARSIIVDIIERRIAFRQGRLAA
jgi:hypothetical protein